MIEVGGCCTVGGSDQRASLFYRKDQLLLERLTFDRCSLTRAADFLTGPQGIAKLEEDRKMGSTDDSDADSDTLYVRDSTICRDPTCFQ